MLHRVTIEDIEKAGGLWGILVFIHFVADWVFQTHHEAMSKHVNWKTRSIHCTVYVAAFIPIMLLLKFNIRQYASALTVLWTFHFAQNTSYPLYFWCKYVRRVPTIRDNGMEAFKEFSKTSLGKILLIIVDQTFHVTVLWFIVFLALSGR